MAIVQELTESWFIDRFKEMGREANFSYEARVELYDYLTMVSDDTGKDVKTDVIALCCEWTESTAAEACTYYGIATSDEGQRTIDEIVYDYLSTETLVLPVPDAGTFLYLSF